jgi:hypothetical protein
VLAVACCLLSALVVSSLAGSTHGDGVARAAPPRVTPRVLPLVTVPPPRPVVLHPQKPASSSRGGPARMLFVAAKVVRPPPPVAAIAAPAPRPAAEPPRRGWVAGLFAGS